MGNDEFGRFLVEKLMSNRVDTKYLTTTDDAITTLAFVSISEEGERSFVFSRKPGADMLLCVQDISESYIAVARLLHFGSISMTNETNYAATRRAVEIAKQNGLLVSFDPNIRLNLWESERDCMNRIVEGIGWADIIKLSEEELALITCESSIEAGVQSLSLPKNKLIIEFCINNKRENENEHTF